MRFAPEGRSVVPQVVLLLSLCTPAPSLAAQGGAPGGAGQGTGQGNAANQDEKIRLENGVVVFKVDENNGIPFLEFVKFAQKVTKKTFFIDKNQDPQLAQPDSEALKINLLGPLRIEEDKFYDFFQTILFIKDWVCVPRGSGDSQFVDLIYQGGPRGPSVKNGVRWVDPENVRDFADQTGTFIVTTVQLEYVNAQLASANLRQFFNDPKGLLTLVPVGGNDQRSLMVSGFGPTVNTIVELLKRVDVADSKPEAKLRVIRLEHSAADDIQPILAELLSEKTRVAAQPAGNGNITPPEDLIPVKIETIPNQNKLIIYAHEKTVRDIENMVAQLDTKSTNIDSNYHVYKLINTLAKEMREVLNDFITESTTAVQQAQSGGGGAAGGASAGRREQKPVIRDDEKSNQLLISASRSQYEKIVELIRRLDQRQDQVLIEAALIELGTQDIERLGIELGLLDIGGNKFTRPFGLTSFGLTNYEDTDGNGLPDTRLPDLENPLRGLTGGIIASDDFAIPIVVNALKSDTQSNVLSIPSVLVNNNEDATITSKDSFPTTQSQAGNVTTQTNFGGYQDAGIDLKISPSISEGNYVKLNLRLEVSKFTGSFDSTAAVPPPKTIRTIETVVTMPSGSTMVFGGVIEDQSSETNDGIPLLKDIPLLGALFRSTETTKRKTNLYFFLTPHILSDEDFADLEEMTYRKKLEAARYIGNRRLKVLDPNWRGQDDGKLEDPLSTIEDLDRLGGFDIPTYQRPPSGTTPDEGGAPRLPSDSMNQGGGAPEGPGSTESSTGTDPNKR
ncbi:MAG: hypothetical protein H6832_17215 [Planctomycetes bacterium]|nr:hypothetical protein [Planctomycetota bacterium]